MNCKPAEGEDGISHRGPVGPKKSPFGAGNPKLPPSFEW